MKLPMKISLVLLAAFVSFGSVARAQAPAPTPAPFVLVTDVDDTIKVSHIMDTVSKVIRFLSDPVPFAGMATLYGEMLDAAKARDQRTAFIVLSGTPTLFESSIWEFLEVMRFPEPKRVITRPMLLDTRQYKTEAVGTIVQHPFTKGATTILIGDDTEQDFPAYDDALAMRGVQPAEKMIYIRRVSGKATKLTTGSRRSSAGAMAFDSAADIAMAEFVQGRLSRASVEKIINEVGTEKSFERLFVPGEYCPGDKSPRGSTYVSSFAPPADLLARYIKLEDYLRSRCRGLNAIIWDLIE